MVRMVNTAAFGRRSISQPAPCWPDAPASPLGSAAGTSTRGARIASAMASRSYSWNLLTGLYQAPRFLHSSTIKRAGHDQMARIDISPDAALKEAVAEHPYLDYVIEGFFSRESR